MDNLRKFIKQHLSHHLKKQRISDKSSKTIKNHIKKCGFLKHNPVYFKRFSSSAFFSSNPGLPSNANIFTLYASTPG